MKKFMFIFFITIIFFSCNEKEPQRTISIDELVEMDTLIKMVKDGVVFRSTSFSEGNSKHQIISFPRKEITLTNKEKDYMTNLITRLDTLHGFDLNRLAIGRKLHFISSFLAHISFKNSTFDSKAEITTNSDSIFSFSCQGVKFRNKKTFINIMKENKNKIKVSLVLLYCDFGTNELLLPPLQTEFLKIASDDSLYVDAMSLSRLRNAIVSSNVVLRLSEEQLQRVKISKY